MAALYNPGSEIVKAFMEGVRARREKEQIELDNKKQEEQTKQFNQTLDEHQREFDLTQAMNKALHEVQIHEARQKQLSEVAASGLPVVGASETQTINPQEDPVQMLNVGMDKQGIAPHIGRQIQFDNGETYTIPSLFDWNQQRAEQEKALLAPKTAAAIEQATGIAKARLPGQLQLEQLKIDAQNLQEAEKFRNQQKLAQERDVYNKQNIRLRSSLGLGKSEEKDANKFLTPDEAAKLGVNYGMTRGEAAKLSITPMRQLSTSEQAKLNGLLLMRTELNRALELGEQSKFSAHTPYIGDIYSGGRAKLGLATQDEIDYRTALGRWSAEQLHEKYGSVLSAGELKRAESWIPSLSEAGVTARSKLKQGVDDLTNEINLIQNPTMIRANTPGSKLGGKKLTLHYNDGSTEQVDDTPENRLKFKVGATQ